MLFFDEALLSGARPTERGGMGMEGRGESGPSGELVRWDYVLFLLSLTASCLPKFPCPTAGETCDHSDMTWASEDDERGVERWGL